MEEKVWPFIKECRKLFQYFDGFVHDRHQVYCDMLRISAYEIVEMSGGATEKEQQGLEQIIQRYTQEGRAHLRKIIAFTTRTIIQNPFCDLLGPLNNLLIKDRFDGDSFTPEDLSKLMSKLCFSPSKKEIGEAIKRKGHISLYDDACGSGSLILDAGARIKKMGFDPTKHVVFTAVDLNPVHADACYIQTSLSRMCGSVCVGNTLTEETGRVLETPALYGQRTAHLLRQTLYLTKPMDEKEGLARRWLPPS